MKKHGLEIGLPQASLQLMTEEPPSFEGDGVSYVLAAAQNEASEAAVNELLKIATMMNKAMQSSENIMDDFDLDGDASFKDFNMSSKLHNLKAAR